MDGAMGDFGALPAGAIEAFSFDGGGFGFAGVSFGGYGPIDFGDGSEALRLGMLHNETVGYFSRE